MCDSARTNNWNIQKSQHKRIIAVSKTPHYPNPTLEDPQDILTSTDRNNGRGELSLIMRSGRISFEQGGEIKVRGDEGSGVESGRRNMNQSGNGGSEVGYLPEICGRIDEDAVKRLKSDVESTAAHCPRCSA